MMGLLKPVLEKPDRFTSVHIRQSHVEHDEIVMLGFGRLDATSRRVGFRHLEFLVQGELIPQRPTEILIVVDKKDLACSAHALKLQFLLGDTTFAGETRQDGFIWTEPGAIPEFPAPLLAPGTGPR